MRNVRYAAYLPAEELTPDYLYDVAEPASEESSPYHRRDTAVAEHGEGLFHAVLEPELFQRERRADDHEKSVSGVREHHSEEQIIEERHYRSRVYIAL